MRITVFAATWLAITVAAAAAGEEVRATYRVDLAGDVDQRIEAELDDWLSYYRDLHAHPELSLQETRSARRVAERLTAAGYSVTTDIGGTGVVGILDNGRGPTLLIRGDMDALPIVEETNLPYRSEVRVKTDDGRVVGVMHACGHDIHQVCLVGTAQILSQLRDKWSGRLMIVAQPAEEIGLGADMMIKDGLFERFGRPDYCFALHLSDSHPAGVVSYTPGWALANVDSVDITIYGRGGHGSRPSETIDPVVMAGQVIVGLQTIVSRRISPHEPAVITVGSVHAGSKHNIIPEEAKLQLTVRSYSEETRRTLLDGIRQVTVGTCRALGAERDPQIGIRDDEFTPAVYNDPAFAAAASEVFRRALGGEHVVQREAVMGGEDFGRYPAHLNVPGLLFWLGSVPQGVYDESTRGGPPIPSLHSSKYRAEAPLTIKTGVKSLTSLALSLLETNE